MLPGRKLRNIASSFNPAISRLGGVDGRVRQTFYYAETQAYVYNNNNNNITMERIYCWNHYYYGTQEGADILEVVGEGTLGKKPQVPLDGLD